MVATPSTMVALDSSLPQFKLPAVNAGTKQTAQVSFTDFLAQPVLVMFICNHCPYVLHIVSKLTAVANQFIEDGGAALAINSNDIMAYPQDAPDKMVAFAKQYGFEFPYCFDENQSVAKAFAAACTPDIYLFDAGHSLCYRGQFDGSRPGSSIPVDGRDLSNAIAALLQNRSPSKKQHASLGCNIKWKPGQEPDYF